MRSPWRDDQQPPPGGGTPGSRRLTRNGQLIAGRLARLGYFGPPPAPDSTASSAPANLDDRQYAAAYHSLLNLHGLAPTTDEASLLRYLELPRCGSPDFARGPNAAGMCQWPVGHVVRVGWSISLPGIDAETINTAFRNALRSWEAVCGIRFETDITGTANIDARSGPIDGAGNVLAWSYLPCGASTTTRLSQLYDSRDQWTVYGPRMLEAVICHEVGHALGLDHLGRGQLMAPTVSANIWTPQAGDIAQVVARYGRPKPLPKPEPEEPESPPPAPPGVLARYNLPGSDLSVWLVRE